DHLHDLLDFHFLLSEGLFLLIELHPEGFSVGVQRVKLGQLLNDLLLGLPAKLLLALYLLLEDRVLLVRLGLIQKHIELFNLRVRLLDVNLSAVTLHPPPFDLLEKRFEAFFRFHHFPAVIFDFRGSKPERLPQEEDLGIHFLDPQKLLNGRMQHLPSSNGLKESLQHAAADRMLKLPNSLCFDLPDPLASHPEDLS